MATVLRSHVNQLSDPPGRPSSSISIQDSSTINTPYSAVCPVFASAMPPRTTEHSGPNIGLLARDNTDGSLATGELVAIILGCIFGIAILVTCVVLSICKRDTANLAAKKGARKKARRDADYRHGIEPWGYYPNERLAHGHRVNDPWCVEEGGI